MDRWLAVVRRPVVIVAVIAAVLTSGFAIAIDRVGLDRLPDVHGLALASLPEDTLVYDRTGTVLLADLHPPGSQRLELPLTALGRWLPAATASDAGSSMTQRLVRLRLGAGGPSIASKLRQAALTFEANATYSQSEILDLYLNAVFYGNGAYGAQTAAQRYFGMDAAKLDLAQATLLAGLPERPTDLDPTRNLPGAKRRQRQVLDAMVRDHTVTAREADQAFGEQLGVSLHTSAELAPGFVAYVAQALTAKFGSGVTDMGLRVVSSLDWNLQQQAERSLRQAVQDSASRGVSNGALVAIDPKTGEVRAMVGSVDTTTPGGLFDMALWPPRSPGTAARVFTYTAAVASKRFTMVTPVADVPITVDSLAGPPYSPRNVDGAYHGTCELRACLAGGLAVPAVQVELTTGLPQVVSTARAMGAPPLMAHFDASGTVTYADNDAADRFGPSLTLGGYGETPLRMATAMSVLAAGGALRPPSPLHGVMLPDGTPVLGGPARARQAIDPGAAAVVSEMLADDANRQPLMGSGSALVLPGRHAAALTGTSEAFTDAWAMGYTPSLATAVWMGNPDFRPLLQGTDALAVAAPAWHGFMQAALDQMGRGDEWPPPPAGLTTAKLSGRDAWFLPGTSATTPAPSLPPSVRFPIP
jgi:membrane peptidoglycan carboxypeptidase